MAAFNKMGKSLVSTLAMSLLISLCHAEELKPEWEIGAVGLGLSQQAYPGSSYQIKSGLIAPVLIYRGQWLRSDQSGAGLRAINTDKFELDLGFAGSLGSNSNNIPVRQGMPNIGNLIEFGPRGKWYLTEKNSDKNNGSKAWFELPVRSVFNVSGKGKYQGFTLEPQLAYEMDKKPWRVWASAGAMIGDRRLNHTVYGVNDGYATKTRSAYQGKAGLIGWKVGVGVAYAITNDLSVFSTVRLNTVSGASNANSPLVDQKNGLNYGVGILYFFGKSSTLVKP